MICSISCIKNNFIKKTFYSSGELESIRYSHGNRDSVPYKIINYYKSGEVKDSLRFNSEGRLHGTCYNYIRKEQYQKWTNYSHGLLNGLLRVEYDDGRRLSQYFNNDKSNSIQANYDKMGKLYSEYLWLEDTVVARKLYREYKPGDTITTIRKDNGLKDTTIYIADNTFTTIEYAIAKSKFYFETIGSLDFRNRNVDVHSLFNSYTYVTLEDTIYKGSSLNVNLKSYMPFSEKEKEEIHLVVKLGEMYPNFTFKDTIREIRTEKGVVDFNFQIDKYRKGYNLITGDIHYMLDSIKLGTVLLFEDFVVVD
ncbi:toxin-antitoxin system YwqK family antitoxin [Labilibacter marinus]|uniref:hypothetical protein n=1 Tax=Labilibacter marinus TaxID=1477105 RepID=UPI001179CCF1|nr:hypothetical protein [Labilibacter marinus]